MLHHLLFLLLSVLNVTLALRFDVFARQDNPADDPNRTPSPTITRPRHIDRWNALTVQTVTWDNDGLDVKDLKGTLLFGFLEPNTTRYVYEDQPLAQGFALSDGAVNVIIPDVPSGVQYFMILLGDMNNTSPLFAILGRDDNLPSAGPPLSLPPQTMTTQSATITDTNVLSTVGVRSTSTSPASSSRSTSSPSPTNTPNGAPHHSRKPMVAHIAGALVVLAAGMTW